MALPLDDILSLSGNKYEVTVAAVKYARYLAQSNDDMLEIPVGNNKKERLTLVAMRHVLQGKVKYEVEPVANNQ